MRPPEHEGPRLTIRCMVRASGRCPAGDFLDELQTRDRLRLVLVFRMLGERGHLQNDTKFKKLRSGIWEIKSGQIRLFCFFASGLLVLAFGVRKKSRKARTGDIEKALAMKVEFESTPEEQRWRPAKLGSRGRS